MTTDSDIQDRRIRVYDLHSWSGIILGLLIFVVIFSGCIALFKAELQPWQDPVKRLTVAEEPVPIHDTFAEWIVTNSEGEEVTFSAIRFPTTSEPYYMGQLNLRKEDGTIEFLEQRWDTSTGEPLPSRGKGAVEWLYDFHRELGWPELLGGRTVGRAIVGIVGVVLMLSILTGIITHRKMMKEFFTLRTMRSIRLKWQDTHKVLGLWTLPFSIMISFTGAFLGVIALLLPIMAVIVVKGDTEKLIETLGFGPQERTGAVTQMLSVDEVYKMRHSQTPYPPERVNIQNWGDESAIYEAQFRTPNELTYYEVRRMSGVTGEELPLTAFQEETVATRVVAAASPLHYATFGGIALKFLYVVLAIVLAVITAFGNLMWLERRLHGNEGSKSEAFYKRLGQVTIGVTMGLPVATAGVLLYDMLYVGAEVARFSANVGAFFSSWGLVLAFALIIKNQYAATRGLMALTGLLFASLPIFNGVVHGEFFWQGLMAAHTNAAWADVAFLVTGLLTIGAAIMMPMERVEKQRKPRRQATYDPSLVPGE